MVKSNAGRDQDSFIGFYHSVNDPKENYFVYADVYRGMFEDMLKLFLEKKAFFRHHDYGALPMIFLFRHYIELQLKGLILGHGGNFGRTHEIGCLIESLLPIMKGRPISKTALRYMKAIGKLDKKSDGFRYPYDVKGQKFFQNLSSAERETLHKINKLKNLEKMSKTVFYELEVAEGFFDPDYQAALQKGN